MRFSDSLSTDSTDEMRRGAGSSVNANPTPEAVSGGPDQEEAMSTSKGQVRIELTSDQKAQIRKATKKDAEALELSVEELEQRIAPLTVRKAGGTPLGY
jgi:molybdenum-dependent DNA-binding transcriptional regulator ModE